MEGANQICTTQILKKYLKGDNSKINVYLKKNT